MGDTDQPGLALLLNEINSKIEVLIFLFPYCDSSNVYGVQSLMLPVFKFDSEWNFIQSNFLEMLY